MVYERDWLSRKLSVERYKLDTGQRRKTEGELTGACTRIKGGGVGRVKGKGKLVFYSPLKYNTTTRARATRAFARCKPQPLFIVHSNRQARSRQC